MPRHTRVAQALPTIWRVPDPLGERIAPLLAARDPPTRPGRPRSDARAAREAILSRRRRGVHWTQLPAAFPRDRSVHRTFQRGIARGVGDRLWATLVSEGAALGGGDGDEQSPGLFVGRRPTGDKQSRGLFVGHGAVGGDAVGPNPPDRGKKGVKRSLRGERTGGPGAGVGAGANGHDCQLLAQTIDASVVERPAPTPERPQHVCLDKGDDNPTGHTAVAAHGSVPPIRRIGEEKRDEHGETRSPARRWVGERTLAWLSKCRALLVRSAKKASNSLALLKLACILIWFRRVHQLCLLG